MAKTRKPCPGCGESDSFLRDANKVCKECQNQLIFAKAQAKKLKRETVGISFPEQPHWLPYIRFERGTGVQNAFHALVLACAHNEIHQTDIEHYYSEDHHLDMEKAEVLLKGSEGHRVVCLPKEAIEPLRKLYQAIHKISENAYQEGFEEGSDMLGQLISGELKNEDINEHAKRSKA